MTRKLPIPRDIRAISTRGTQRKNKKKWGGRGRRGSRCNLLFKLKLANVKTVRIHTDSLRRSRFPNNDGANEENIRNKLSPRHVDPRTYGELDNTFSRSPIAATSAYVNTRLNSYHSADRK